MNLPGTFLSVFSYSFFLLKLISALRALPCDTLTNQKLNRLGLYLTEYFYFWRQPLCSKSIKDKSLVTASAFWLFLLAFYLPSPCRAKKKRKTLWYWAWVLGPKTLPGLCSKQNEVIFLCTLSSRGQVWPDQLWVWPNHPGADFIIHHLLSVCANIRICSCYLIIAYCPVMVITICWVPMYPKHCLRSLCTWNRHKASHMSEILVCHLKRDGNRFKSALLSLEGCHWKIVFETGCFSWNPQPIVI